YDPGVYHDHDRSSIKSKRSQTSMSTVSTGSVANQPNDSDQTPNSVRALLYIPNSIWTRMFATTMVTEMVFTVAIEIWVLMSLWNHLGDDTGATESHLQSFLGLYVFGLLYELALSYDALRRRNTIQLVGLCVCNLGLTAYGVLQMQEIEPTLKSMMADALIETRLLHLYRAVLILVPIILAIGTLCMTFLTWKLRAEFSWSIYKNISADLQMKRRYLTYQVYIALLKFDFFFVFGTQLQFLLIVVKFESLDFIVNAAFVPIAIASLVLSAYYCKREKRKSLIGMMFLMLITMAFLVLAIIRVNSNYTSARVSITLFAIFSLLLLIATLINSLLCVMNFHQGLMTHVNPPDNDPASLQLKQMETPTRFLLS
ncbi:uncharacterized protein N7483_000011, partial [Penicillium malachiteum]|uniref:uncharacterized protein n=1 Tax=Penicillium malachiteum TaxID=1324776 RepID=UPI002547B254